MELLKNTCHDPSVEAPGADTNQANSLAAERAEMTALVGWNVHKAGLADVRQVVLRRVPDEGDVVLASEHEDQLLQQSLLLIFAGRAAMKRFDNDAGVIRKRVEKLQLRIDHGRPS